MGNNKQTKAKKTYLNVAMHLKMEMHYKSQGDGA